jgi:hypothetical protein
MMEGEEERESAMDPRSIDVVIPAAQSARHVFRGQLLHLAALALLWVVAEALAAPALADSATARFWFRLGLTLAVLHQVVVWLVFRAQLGWGLLTRWWGNDALRIWTLIFLPLLAARPVIVLILGLIDHDSLAMPAGLARGLGVILVLPALYTLWSVWRHFGFERAMGGDHFDVGYRGMPLVREGAFAWSGDAMYTFGFLVLWAIALETRSQSALVLALFQHAAIWAHFHGTERPDMELIYGGRRGPG